MDGRVLGRLQLVFVLVRMRVAVVVFVAVLVVTALGLTRTSAPKPPAMPTTAAPARAPDHLSNERRETFLISGSDSGINDHYLVRTATL